MTSGGIELIRLTLQENFEDNSLLILDHQMKNKLRQRNFLENP